MDLQTTAQTLKLFEPVKTLHLESTDVCNAACPLCPRELDTNFDKSIKHHLAVEQIKNLFSEEFIRNLDKMFMCGNYGDPAAGKHTLEIYRYFRQINPNIVLGMNTNGSLQSPAYWEELASIFTNPHDFVIWSIDGLEDTNHIYRINTQWHKIINNVKAYIAAGGNAQWDMLVYEHNQHQVDQVQELAKSMGFTWFRAKVSSRPTEDITWLKQPTGWTDPVVTQGEIQCIAEKDKSLYVSAQGILYRCCWLGYHPSWSMDYFEDIKKTWNTDNCHRQCKKICTTRNQGNSFSNQWQRAVALC